MAQSNTDTTRLNALPPSGNAQSPALSAYKRDEIVKAKHENKGAEKKAVRVVGQLCHKETMASLYKRKSFRKSSKELHSSMLNRKAVSVNPGAGRETCATASREKNVDAASATLNRATVDAATLQAYASEALKNLPSDALNSELAQTKRYLLQLRDDVEKRCKIFSDALELKKAGSVDEATGNDGFLHRSDSSPTATDMECILDKISRDTSSATQSLARTQSAFFRTASFSDLLKISPSLEIPNPPHEISRPNSQHATEPEPREEDSVGEEKRDELVQGDEPRCQSGLIACDCGALISVNHLVSDSRTPLTVVRVHHTHPPENSRRPNVRGNLVMAGITLVVGVFVGHIFSRGEN